MSDKNVQGAPASQHDIKHDSGGVTKVPDPRHIEQGTKNSNLRDAGDHATNPTPKK